MIQITHNPFSIDFVENHPVFKLQRWPDADGQQLKVRFKITYPDGSSVFTPDMIYDYIGNNVTVGTDIIKHYFKRGDIPFYQDGFTPRVMECNALKVVMYYGDNTYVERPLQTDSFVMVDGYIEPYRWVNNYPDWLSVRLARFFSRNDVDIFGQDNGDTIYTYRGCEQYLYVHNYSSSPVQMETTLTVKHKSGAEAVSTPSMFAGFENPVVPAKSTVRLRVDADAFGNALRWNVADVIQYTISIRGGGNTIYRTFVLNQAPYNVKYLLLKNKLNLYESFAVTDVKKELSVSGDRTVKDAYEAYRISDIEKIYTARTGLKTEDDIKLLDIALHKKGNILLNGQWADYITIVPNTWTVVDQREDLIEVEFQYKIVKREAREAGSIEIEGGASLSEEFVIGAHARIDPDTVMDVRN